MRIVTTVTFKLALYSQVPNNRPPSRLLIFLNRLILPLVRCMDFTLAFALITTLLCPAFLDSIRASIRSFSIFITSWEGRFDSSTQCNFFLFLFFPNEMLNYHT